jgi:hypothetical protein
VGEYLFRRACIEVFHIGESETGAELFTGYGPAKEIYGSCGIISFFDDGSMYLVNRDYQKTQRFRMVTDTPLTVMRDGAFVAVNCPEFVLEPGAAVLLKPGI